MPARYLTLSSREPAGGLREGPGESGLGLGGRGQEALLPGHPQAGEQAPGGQGQGRAEEGRACRWKLTSESWNAAWEIPELIHHPQAPWERGPGSWDPQEERVHTPPNPHTRTHTREHKHGHMCAYQCTHMCTHAHANTAHHPHSHRCTCVQNTHTQMHTCTTHTCTDVHVYTYVRAQVYVYNTHVCAHRCPHTQMHTHTRSPAKPLTHQP